MFGKFERDSFLPWGKEESNNTNDDVCPLAGLLYYVQVHYMANKSKVKGGDAVLFELLNTL